MGLGWALCCTMATGLLFTIPAAVHQSAPLCCALELGWVWCCNVRGKKTKAGPWAAIHQNNSLQRVPAQGWGWICAGKKKGGGKYKVAKGWQVQDGRSSWVAEHTMAEGQKDRQRHIGELQCPCGHTCVTKFRSHYCGATAKEVTLSPFIQCFKQWLQTVTEWVVIGWRLPVCSLSSIIMSRNLMGLLALIKIILRAQKKYYKYIQSKGEKQ